jgi:23S rRNA pseudouridine955/2504/2580 synthase
MDHDEFLAINKPANLAVQGGSKIKLSIDDALSYLSLNSCKQYKLVHRLDKETSGVLLIAKGYAAANRLTRAFKERRMHKTYLAVLSGQITKQEGVVRGKLQYSKAGQGSEEKYAESLFKVIGSGEVLGRVCSALEFQPVTGRMHQLRIHSVMLGAPILGDKKYGGWPYKRLMLHAKALVIAKEVFGQEILLQAPVPEGFTGYMT